MFLFSAPIALLDVTQRFDSVFWMGDLNFRIEVYKGKQAVEDLVKVIQEKEHPNFEDLVSGDQLSKLIVEGAFSYTSYRLCEAHNKKNKIFMKSYAGSVTQACTGMNQYVSLSWL